jgi:low temperature requirement protein LtrA
MNNYNNYFKQAFELPELRNETHVKTRSASPIELFFDLMFVAIFAAISHYFYKITATNTLLAFGLFMTTYIVWNNINMYMARFFSSSYFVRFGVLLIMIPLLFISGAGDADGKLSIITISVSIFISRIVLIVIWYISVFKNTKIKNESFKNGVKIDIRGFALSAIIGLACIINPTQLTLIISLFASIFAEIPYIISKYRKARRDKFIKSAEMPKIDDKLLNERNLLIMIIIFGEGVITSVNNIKLDSAELFQSIFFPILTFATVFLFFIRIFEEMTISGERKTTPFTVFTSSIIAFNTLLIYSLLNQLGKFPDYVGNGLKLLLVLAFLFIALGHLISNIIELRREKNPDLIKFYKFDNVTLYFMLLFTIAIPFINNPYMLLILSFLFFLIHTFAIPYRYKAFKKIVDEEY